MKAIAHIAAALLGGLFVFFSAMVLLKLAPQPEIPKDTPAWYFMSAVGPTGFMTFVKVIELVGGIFVIIPKLRSVGLLLLGPIIVNILAYHQFIDRTGIFEPMLVGISGLALYVLWAERSRWKGLVG
jgi:putative oxidoreductase